MAKLIKRAGGRYSVRYIVPTSLRPIVGKTQVWKTTGTSCLSEAKKRMPRILADILDDVERERRLVPSKPVTPKSAAWLMDIARQLNEQVESGELQGDDDTSPQEWASIIFADHLEQHFDARGINPETDTLTPDHLRVIRGASKMVSHAGTYLPLSEGIERHLSEKRGRINPSTLLRKRIILDDFATFAGNPEIAAVDRAMAGRYVSEVLLPAEVAVSTKTWRIGCLSACWNWFERKGLCQSNPWRGLAVDVRGSTRGKPKLIKRAWHQSEIDCLKTLPDGHVIKDVSIIRLHSGIRVEECCCLTTNSIDLEAGTMQIGTADDHVKSTSSVRLLPLHPVLIPIMARLVENATSDGYLFDMPRRGQDKKRSHNFGKTAGKWLRDVVSKDPAISMYTLRHTYSASMRNLGIDQDLIAFTTGHKAQSILFSTYAPEIAIKRLRDAVSRLDFGF